MRVAPGNISYHDAAGLCLRGSTGSPRGLRAVLMHPAFIISAFHNDQTRIYLPHFVAFWTLKHLFEVKENRLHNEDGWVNK